MPNRKRYTVRYRDAGSQRLEGCFYAGDAFEARVLAMEDIPFIRTHPNAIDLISCEEHQSARMTA